MDDNGKPKPEVRHYDDGTASSLRNGTNYKKLRFYHRSDVLYQLTQLFCKKYFKKWGDRTVDQMVQAARSCKQNIVEGSVDGETSMESEIKLMGFARGSNCELLEDYLRKLKQKKPNLSMLGDEMIYELMSITRDGGITLSAVMLFCRYPQVYYPQLCITAVAVPGTEIGGIGPAGNAFWTISGSREAFRRCWIR